jgi:hypothetical protein
MLDWLVSFCAAAGLIGLVILLVWALLPLVV